MKNKYQRMSKEEKKEIKESYKKSKKGQNMMIRLNRLIITGIVGLIVFGIYLYLNLTGENTTVWDYIVTTSLLLASLVFIIGSFILRGKEYNKHAIKPYK